MVLWFVVSIIAKRNDVADIAWGLGFVVLAWFSYMLFAPLGIKPVIVNMLVTLWGLRLAFHILIRNCKKSEDRRYNEWRQEWSKIGAWYFYLRSFFQVYMLQGLLLFIIVIPVLVINQSHSIFSNTSLLGIFDTYLIADLNLLDCIGLIIWSTGYFFEVVGDWQLKQFTSNPSNKGKIITTGLWKYSRHPNYFGEVTMWWGIFVLGLASSGTIATLISPLTITFLILFVSGVPMLEKKYRGRKDFEAYKKQTSVFIPLPPKRI